MSAIVSNPNPLSQIELDYHCRWQFKDYHDRKKRWAVLVCHRGAGKTVATVCDLILHAARHNKTWDGRYAMIAPFYNQVKDNAWTYLKQYAQPLLAEEPREAELSVLLRNRARIRLYGSDNPDRLRGIHLDGLVLDEFGSMLPSVGKVIKPMLSARHGCCTYIGTPNGKNAFYDTWRDALKDQNEWFTLMLKASTAGVLSAEEIEVQRRQMPDDEFDQEFECSWEAATKGAFYGDELRIMQAEDRIRPLEIDKAVRVQTTWDLGVSDSTAIWFIQAVGRERRLVDYYETSGVGLDHYVQVLYDKRQQHGWTYGEHFFPHDIQVREFTSGQSRLAALAKHGIEATVVPNYSELDGINAVRKMLGRTWIDSERCERGLEALRQYRREYDDKLKDWKKNALHDFSSHAADSLRYFAIGFDDTSTTRTPRRRIQEPPSGATHWSA